MRTRVDGFAIAAAGAALPGLLAIAVLANRWGPIHLVPVIAGGLPFLATSRRRAVWLCGLSAALFLGFAIIGGFTVGALFLPSAVLAFVAMVRAGVRHYNERRCASPGESRRPAPME